MSYNGKKPVFDKVIVKESTQYLNLSQTPTTPESGYFKTYFKNGAPYYLDQNGIERSLLNISLNISIPVQDIVYQKEPVNIYSSGKISFRKSKDTVGSLDNTILYSVIPTNSGFVQPITAQSFSTSYLTSLSVIAQGLDNRLYGVNTQTMSVIDLGVDSEFFSTDVHPLDLDIIHNVYEKDGKIIYNPTTTTFSSNHEQELFEVTNLQYLKILCFTRKNVLSAAHTDREFVVILVDDNVLKIALFSYSEEIINIPESQIVQSWYDSMYGVGYISGDKLVVSASLLDEYSPIDMTGKTIKHIHMWYDTDDEYVNIAPIVDDGVELSEIVFNVTNVVAATREITYSGTASRAEPRTADQLGSFPLVGVDAMYYRVGDVVTTPAGSIDLSSYGSLVTVTSEISKNDIVSAIFVDRTVEISIIQDGGDWFHSITVMDNDFLLPDGTNYFATNIHDTSNDLSSGSIKSYILYLDTANALNSVKANEIDNIFDVKDTPNVIALQDSDVSRSIKPFSIEKFSITGDYDNRISVYDYTTDTFTQYAITIQGQASGVIPYAIPLGFNRIAVLNEDIGDSTNVYIDVRSTSSVPYAVLGSGAFGLSANFSYQELILLSTGKFAFHNGTTSVSIFEWNEGTQSISRTFELTSSADFSNDDIIYIAPASENKFVVMTRSSTHQVSIHTVSSGVVTGTTVMGSFDPDTSDSLLFSFSEGVIAFTQNISDTTWKTIILDNDLAQVFESDTEFFPETLLSSNGFTCSNLKYIISGTNNYTIKFDNYNLENQIYEITDISSIGTGTGNKQDCPIIPDSLVKPSRMVTRWVHNDGVTDGNLLIDYLKDTGTISESVGVPPSIQANEALLFDFTGVENNDTVFAFIQPDGDLFFKALDGGSASPDVFKDTFTTPNNLVVKCPFNDVVVAFVSDESGVHIVSDNTDSYSVFDVQEIHPVCFGTSFALFYKTSTNQVGVVTGLVDDTGTVTIKGNQAIDSEVLHFAASNFKMSMATVLINKASGVTLKSFKVDETSVEFIDSETISEDVTDNIFSDLMHGVLLGDGVQVYYSTDELGEITVHDTKNEVVTIGSKRVPIGESHFAHIYNRQVRLVEIQVNSMYDSGSIPATGEHILYDVAFADSVLSIYSKVGEIWYISQFDINLSTEFGTYIGVSQENQISGYSASTILKGGVSSVHSGLTPNSTIWSSDGTVELGTSISTTDILLTTNPIEEVVRPVNVTPSAGAISITRPTTLTGSAWVDSLYGRPSAIRRFRIATDKLFQTIVYEDEEDPFAVSHTISDNSFIEENVVYYWQCQDENDLGYLSEWSVPTTFAVSLVSEVLRPSITDPAPDETNIGLTPTVTSSAFSSDPAQTHVNSDWEVYDQDGTLVFSSYNDTTNKVSIVVSSGLEYSGVYDIRVRHEGDVAGKSPWSNLIRFYTEEISGFMGVAHQNAPYVSFYSKDVGTFTKLNDPDILPTGTGRGIGFASDGAFAVVGHETAPRLTMYSRSGRVFTKVDNIDTLPSSDVNTVSFSSTSDLMAVTSKATPFVYFYERNSGAMEKLADPADLPASESSGCRFSLDETYAAASILATPYIMVWSVSGTTFTKLADPAALPSGQANGVALSSDGTYIAVALNVAPFIEIYKRTGSTLTKLSDPSNLPTASAFDVAFSPDDQYMAVAHTVLPYITVYSRSGDTFTKIANPTAIPTGTARSVSFSSDSTQLFVAHSSYPYFTIYNVDGMVKITTPLILPTGDGNGIDNVTL